MGLTGTHIYQTATADFKVSKRIKRFFKRHIQKKFKHQRFGRIKLLTKINIKMLEGEIPT